MAYDVFGAQTRKVGQDTEINLWDEDGGKWTLRADDDNGLVILKNDTTVSTLTDTGSRINKLKVTAKTADYTVTAADSGTVFTTTGASGAVNFTLPATATAGLHYWFFNTVDQNMLVTAGTADTMVAFNDVAADSIAFSTASEKIGSGVHVVGDGSKWLAFVYLGAETATPTIAT